MSQLLFNSSILQLNNLALHAALKKYSPIIQYAKFGSLESEDEDHATYFFLKPDMVNGRGWGVTSESVPENIKSAIGMPYTITSSDFIPDSEYGKIYDHPSLEHLVPLGLAAPGTVHYDDIDAILAFQQKFKVGTIKEFFYNENDDHWRVVVTKDPKFRGREMPPFVSPAVWKLDKTEPDESMTKWRVLHLTGLMERPAYGAIAIKKAECKGSLIKCHSQLRAASLDTGKFEMLPCEFKKLNFDMSLQKAYNAALTSQIRNCHVGGSSD